MLKTAANKGAQDALAYFNLTLKTAGIPEWGSRQLNRGIDLAKATGIVGMAPETFVQGPKAFSPGGALHWRNVLWPTIPGAPVRQAIGRIGTGLSALAIPGMMKADENEGTLSKALGAVGGLGGMMYGGMAGGMFGSPIGLAAGRSLGHGLGHLLGSRPHATPIQQPMYQEMPMQHQMPPGTEKLSNLQQGAAAYNPTLNNQAKSTGVSSVATMQPPKPSAPAIAAAAPKSQVLG